jgi:hypothetical protein
MFMLMVSWKLREKEERKNFIAWLCNILMIFYYVTPTYVSHFLEQETWHCRIHAIILLAAVC